MWREKFKKVGLILFADIVYLREIERAGLYFLFAAMFCILQNGQKKERKTENKKSVDTHLAFYKWEKKFLYKVFRRTQPSR